MKTQIIRIKNHELVNVCDMTFQQFFALSPCIQTATRRNSHNIAGLAYELHWTSSCWHYDWDAKMVSIIGITWEHVEALAAILADECYTLSRLPMNHWYRNNPPFKLDHLSKILESLNVTFEARVEE